MMLLLVVSDLLSVGLAWVIGMGVRIFLLGRLDYQRYVALWPVLFLWVLTFGIMGLYRGGGVTARIFITPVEELKRTTVGITWAFITVVAGTFLLQGGMFYSRLIMGIAWFGSLVLVPCGRAVVRNCFAHRAWWGSAAVILGAGKTARQVVRILQQQPELGLKPVAVLTDAPCAEQDIYGVPILGALERARQLGRERGIAYCIVALDEDSNRRLFVIHKEYGDLFPHMMVIPELGGLASLWIQARDVGGILGLEIRHNLLISANRWLKRSLDLAVAIPLLVLTSPLLLLLVCWIRLVNPGRALYSQEREGQQARRIRMWKLRTMYLDAEARLQKLLKEDPAAHAEWQRYFKLKNDPRILPGVGLFLRKFSLDELPQLWNVITGTMSMVGPRPFPSYHLEAFDEEFRTLRHSVLPGLTGLWQVTARSDGDLEVQKRLDSYYIRNWSLWLDLYLMARSFWVVVSGHGAY
jgi:Undecaprenyl-phosphate galactose phosphotransferase WbaP